MFVGESQKDESFIYSECDSGKFGSIPLFHSSRFDSMQESPLASDKNAIGLALHLPIRALMFLEEVEERLRPVSRFSMRFLVRVPGVQSCTSTLPLVF